MHRIIVLMLILVLILIALITIHVILVSISRRSPSLILVRIPLLMVNVVIVPAIISMVNMTSVPAMVPAIVSTVIIPTLNILTSRSVGIIMSRPINIMIIHIMVPHVMRHVIRLGRRQHHIRLARIQNSQSVSCMTCLLPTFTVTGAENPHVMNMNTITPGTMQMQTMLPDGAVTVCTPPLVARRSPTVANSSTMCPRLLSPSTSSSTASSLILSPSKIELRILVNAVCLGSMVIMVNGS